MGSSLVQGSYCLGRKDLERLCAQLLYAQD